MWKVHCTRCVTAEKESDAAAGFQMSLDGTPHHDTVNYRGIIIGTPILKNGTFETLNKKGMPADFRLVAATTSQPEEIPPALRSRCTEIFFKL